MTDGEFGQPESNAPGESGGASLSREDLAGVAGHLSSLTAHRLPMDSYMRSVAAELPNGPQRRLLTSLATGLAAGQSLDQLVAKHGAAFPDYFRGLVAAGVKTNRLAELLDQYADDSARFSRLARGIWLSIAYPLFVLACALVITVLITVAVIPGFKSIFQDFGIELPQITLEVIAVSDFIVHYLYWLPVWAAVFIGLLLMLGRLSGSWWARIPVLRTIWYWCEESRFYRLLANLVSGSVGLPDAIQLAGAAAGDRSIDQRSRRWADFIRSGGAFSSTVDPTLHSLAKWGDANNALPDALRLISDIYTDRAEARSRLLRTTLPVLLLILVIGMAAFMALSMLLPLIRLLNALGGGK